MIFRALVPVALFATAAAVFAFAASPQKLGAPRTTPTKFQQALPGYRFEFPRDHASHPKFATEWWYYTGHLQSKSGRKFGYQLTFFRVALAPEVKRASKWATRDVVIGHFALTDISRGQFYFDEKAARAAAGMAGADAKSPHIWLADWDLRFTGDGNGQTFRARGVSRDAATKNQTFAVSFGTRALKKPVVQGENGVSQKSEGVGQASHYYSFSRLETTGEIRIGDERFQVSGQSWFDKEFGSNQLGKNQIGWDWFSLQLSDGRELMLYQLRTQNGGIDPFSSGTLIEKDGSTRHVKRDDFSITPQAFWTSPRGAKYPAKWQLEIPREQISLIVEPEVAAQELVTPTTGVSYWEGASRVSGTSAGNTISGQGYVELTGYDGTLNGKF
ncbi:MAG TPA: lipocalin-like domain-containing protein [Abditibacteriaceae bacterium]|jgi:predicted secreted hydrolase